MAACCAILWAALAAITFNGASLPTCYGKEFTDRLFASRARAPSGAHEFDLLCAELGIEHRLAPPQHPQTNGIVERFNGRIEEMLRSHHFRSGAELETTLHRYVVRRSLEPMAEDASYPSGHAPCSTCHIPDGDRAVC